MEPTDQYQDNEPEVEAQDTDSDGDAEVTSEAFERVSAGTNYEDENGEKARVSASIDFEVGADITSAVELYGEEAVFERYKRGVTKDLGNAIRSALNKYLNDEEVDVEDIPQKVQEELSDWRPDVTRKRAAKAPEQNIFSQFDSLSPEKQRELIEALQSKASQGRTSQD